jgi:expansin (peptidoglycan-binding protein)
VRISIVLLTLAACTGGSPGDGDDDPGPPGSCAAPLESTGEGTFYDATGAGNCSFDASPDDLMVAAMNEADYGTAAWCGGCIEVSGPDGTVAVRVVDRCPGCARGDVDLSREAFARIAPLSAGRVPITWREVPCDVSGPIAYHFKDGANAFWTAIQVRNHRYPIARLEAELDGAFVEIPRVQYNYFVQESGLGDGPYALRVTDVHGHVVEDSGIELGDDVTRSGSGQFPTCP